MAGIALLERLDGFAFMRNQLRTLAAERREWAGYPMPLDGLPLVVEPTYPQADALMALGHDPGPAEDWEQRATLRNSFWSRRRRSDILVWELDGRIEWGPSGTGTRIAFELATLDASDAWGIEQEGRAVQTLGSLLRHRAFKQYLLTGMFLERSARSGVTYIFRKLRPTLALARDGKRILCALCMHPIAYYRGSWAGAMTPTDDVIAHLMLMRGDEPMFWRRSTQHPPYRREAGI